MDIPFELIQAIVEQLADSSKALHACALSVTDTTLSLFNHIRALSIAECNLDIHLVLLVSAAFPHIRHLNLDGVAFASPQSLHTFVAAFADLESLRDHPPPPRLHTISYKTDYVPRTPFLRWISAQPPALEHLTLQQLTPSELQSTGALLQALGSNLKSLDISFKGLSSPADVSAHLHLGANTCLHTLTMHIALRHFYGTRHPRSPADAPLALLAPTFPALRRATLALHVSFMSQFDTLDWGAFDVAFSRRAPNLETLTVQVHGAGNWDAFETHEHEHVANAPMPLCQARGTFRGLEFVRRSRSHLSQPA
ncbi:hypothetical protein BD779DRAFT_1666894 [Infundibulicybe gibba]|nr:hypothetical protein BD779DRAFT_1666894 [Infundibulicybe gibba]